jgi:Sec-independent protein translocase protein TatA
MLDNFGMGEFLMLALFALLFFGPERLPQIGAQLGKWLAKLTGYSKAFMAQWSEEAAAVQGAVQDVMMIRDEILAAQAEITETLNSAQRDVQDTINVAQGTVNEATPTVDKILDGSGAPTLASAEEESKRQAAGGRSVLGDDSDAVSKTQDVVNAMLVKQGIALPEEEQEDEALSADAGAPAVVDGEPAAGTDEDEAYQKNLAIIQEAMGPSTKTEPAQVSQDEETPGDGEAAPETVDKETPQPTDTEPAQVETKTRRKQAETAYDKTQRVLDQLVGVEPEPDPEPAVSPESAALEPAQAASADEAPADETSGPTEPSAPEAAAEPPAEVDAVPGVTDTVRAPILGDGVSMDEFTQLSDEVDTLKHELQMLREELQKLRTAEPTQTVTAPLPGDGRTEQEGDGSPAVPVEEVA